MSLQAAGAQVAFDRYSARARKTSTTPTGNRQFPLCADRKPL